MGNWFDVYTHSGSGYGPVAGLFFNQGYTVNANGGVGSLTTLL